MAGDKPPASDLPFVRRALIVVAVGAAVAAVWLLSEVLLLMFGSVLIAMTLRALAAPLGTHLGLGHRWALTIVGVLLSRPSQIYLRSARKPIVMSPLGSSTA